jgi:glycosyltransferase involved in cell wall biosynthesis
MNDTNTKIIVLTFVRHYLPGYKFGGPSRSISNLVNQLGNEFEFRIITSDRDWGDSESYNDIKYNQWQRVGGAMVYYLTPESTTLKGIVNLVKGISYDVLYLNSFFDSVFTIKLMIARRIGWLPIKPIIIAPRGEFEKGSIRIKYLKKYIYIQLARVLGLYKRVIWHASSKYELIDIINYMKIRPDTAHIALNLPAKIIPDLSDNLSVQSVPSSLALRVVFLSRISREKNLDYALRVLSRVKTSVDFDIYGPTEDSIFWKECEELINQLPPNVRANYLGSVHPNQVLNVFGRYDLFFFPTSGENYGHVIAECLLSGTPVLISTETPWRNLQVDGLGWDMDLEQMHSFVEIIEKLCLLSDDERVRKRTTIRAMVMERLLDPSVLEANRQLFRESLLH